MKPLSDKTAAPSRTGLNKLYGLEVIRFLSAVSVLFAHYQHFSYAAGEPTEFIRTKQPFYSTFGFLYELGHNGVQVFWCISGFIFFWKYRVAIAEQTVGARKFFVLRLSRLYPLHFVTLLLVLSLQAVYFSTHRGYFVYQANDITQFILQLFLASNWRFEEVFSFNGPIWSVSVEVLVYLFFFIILRFVGKSVLVSVAVLLVCLTARLLKVNAPVIESLTLFYLGGLSAVTLLHFERKIYNRWLILLAFIVLLVALPVAYLTSTHGHRDVSLLTLMACIPILLFASAQDFGVHPVLIKIVEAAGNMTYSSYLIHFPLQLSIVLFFYHVDRPIPYYSPTFFCVFMIVILAMSYYTYKFFELPAQNLIRAKFDKSKSAPPTSAYQ